METILGKLAYNDDGDYEIQNEDGLVFNLSKVLDYIYTSKLSNQIYLKIMDGYKILFNESSILYKNKNAYGEGKYSYSYFIEGNGKLEDILFDNTDKTLEITLFSEAIGEENYGQFYKKMC